MRVVRTVIVVSFVEFCTVCRVFLGEARRGLYSRLIVVCYRLVSSFVFYYRLPNNPVSFFVPKQMSLPFLFSPNKQACVCCRSVFVLYAPKGYTRNFLSFPSERTSDCLCPQSDVPLLTITFVHTTTRRFFVAPNK